MSATWAYIDEHPGTDPVADRFVIDREALFALGDHVRYVASGSGQDVRTAQRSGVGEPSDQTSDFYEELLVNPTLLALARQRGELDCGGLSHLVVGYGNFTQVVVPTSDGHVSVCIEQAASADEAARAIIALLPAVTS